MSSVPESPRAEEAEPRRWSLRSRMTLWFALTTSSLVMLLAIVSIWVVRRSTERELRALWVEEFEEFEANLSVRDPTRATFEEIAQDLQRKHPQNALAWRVWKDGAEEPWGEFGTVGLFDRVDAPATRELPAGSFDKALRWRTRAIDDGLELGLLLDAERQLSRAKTFTSMAIAFIPISGLIATIAGAVLGRRISRMLQHIAAGFRGIRNPTDQVAVDVAGAPDEVRWVADSLREMLDNIREEADAARFMTSGLAHELRSPIQNLICATQVALLKDRDADRYRQVLEGQHDELRELARAVDNLVTLCATGETHSRGGERFDLGSEAALRLERERSQARRKGVEVELALDGDLELTGDREALLLAIGNVAANAIQWTNAGGTVSIAFEGRESDVHITVEDEGPGIPKELREEVFLPFKRSPTVPGRRQGYGLGLALASRAVASHGGRIDIDEADRGGARVCITLQR